MKKIFCLAACCFLLSAHGEAFWTNADNLERQSQVIRVDHRNGNSEITIEQVVKNPTNTVREYHYLSPVEGNYNLYQDGTGIKSEKLTGPELLERLWSYVETDRALLRLGNYHDKNVFISEPIAINPGESTQIKLKYRTKPIVTQGVNLLHIDVADQLESDLFETSFNLVGANRHFLPPLHLEGGLLTQDNTTTWLHESNNVVSHTPLTFLWSTQTSPKLSYRAADFDYHLQLESLPGPHKWQTITILIDQSGSMFGDRWEQSQTVIKEFLKTMPGSTKFRLGFFDDKIEWFHEQPVSNSAAEQKKLFDWWGTQVPTGRTDWSLLQEVLRDLQLDQGALSSSAGLIVGDFSQFSIPDEDFGSLKSFRRSLLLDFGDNDTAAFWSRFNDGQYQTLISQDENLSQWPYLWTLWQRLHLPETAPNNEALPKEINYFTPDQSLLWLSRTPYKSGQTVSPTADFIPRLWAERRVADDLRRQALTSIDDGRILLLNALIRGLGVSTGVINPQTDIRSALELPWNELWPLIWELESPLAKAQDLVFAQAKPLFRDGDSWITADFADNFSIKSGIEVAPGSVAERQLFYFFPDILGIPFSLGKDVSYCHTQRCVQLDPYGETTPEETHKLDWRGLLAPHWANDYVLELATKNIVPIDPWGDMQLDKPVTRGEFIEWLVKWYFGTDFTERTAEISDPRFSDITDESTAMAEAIYLLRRKGVIQGYPDGTVRADKPLARAEAVKILLALDGFEPSGSHEGELPFRDISGWEAGWVVQAQKTGLVEGYGDGTFKPFQPLTRGEGMKLVVTFD